MPKYKQNWEAEYRDPISDEQARKQAELEEQLNAEIMLEIELCRRMEEDKEFAERERQAWERERMLDCSFYDDEDDYLDEDYRYWQERSDW